MSFRFIIVEDDPNFATLVARSIDGLAEKPITVVDNWKDAMDQIENADVAWVDLRMPSSIEAESIKWVANLRKEHKRVVVVVGSGFITPEVRAHLEQAGIDAVYVKEGQYDPKQMASVVILALMKACKRNPDFDRRLLDRALEWMHERYHEVAAA